MDTEPERGSTTDGDTERPSLKERLRETFGTGSLTGGSVTGGTGGTGGLGTGAGDMSGGPAVDGDPISGGDDGVDASGAGGVEGTEPGQR